MELLRRHYEKISLGFFLVLVLGVSWYLLADLRKVSREIDQYRANSKTLKSAAVGEMIKPLDLSEFKADTFVFDTQRLEWKADNKPGGGDLMNPRRYMRCANPECPYYILYDMDVCPYCHTKQGKKKKKGVSSGDDLDRDGIPDAFEKKYKALDPNVSTDADRDSDGDWFTNRQEYEADTSPDDPKSHPPYAEKLRFLGTIRKPLDIMFTRLMRNDPSDPNSWDLFLRVRKGGRWKNRIRRVGEKAGEYKILAVHYKSKKVFQKATKTEVTVDISEVVLQKGNEEPITLVRNETTFEKGIIVRFLLLSDLYSPARCRQFTAKKGVPFTIEGPNKQTETWVVTDVAPRSVVIKPPDSKPDTKGITVPPLNFRTDFVRVATTAAAPGAMMPGGTRRVPGAMMPGGGSGMPGGGASPMLPTQGGRGRMPRVGGRR
ncbi:MAG: hypothetical protein GXP31_03755 [Kiritimatiellaeota bacterium]|nr:hypothetical protein [Kiritimatiellota bacterium]